MAGLPGPYVPPAPGMPSIESGGGRKSGATADAKTGWPRGVYVPTVPPVPSPRESPVSAPYEALGGELRALVRHVPDFPRPGARFWDVTPLFQAPDLLRRVVDAVAVEAEARGAEAIAGIDPRGLLLAPPVALRLGLPFVPVAAPGTLPGELVAAERRGEGAVPLRLAVQRGRLGSGQRVVIVDDLIQSGSTAATASRLLESVGAIVAGLAFLLEDAGGQGRRLLGRYNVFSLVVL